MNYKQYVDRAGLIVHYSPGENPPADAHLLTIDQYEDVCANITARDRELFRVEGSFGDWTR